MNRIRLLALSALLPLAAYGAQDKASSVVVGIHGGTGVSKSEMTPDLEKGLREGLQQALRDGYAVLQKNGSSLDAVEAAIRVLEDNPLFNAGKGAVFTSEGHNELDASIMEGKTLKAGAVASVTIIKNPISAARAVMEKSPHVLLIGRGAEVFATQAGLDIVDPAYFWTERRWKSLQEWWREHGRPPGIKGTVGAVALDRAGNLAAGTSTGGMTGKRPGRVGDSPIIGAGTYADNASCAVSATGHGEYFIRYAVAHDIVALMKYKSLPVDKAADEVINRKLKDAGGEGGVIALDPAGNFAMTYNSKTMYRGYVTKEGQVNVLLYER